VHWWGVLLLAERNAFAVSGGVEETDDFYNTSPHARLCSAGAACGCVWRQLAHTVVSWCTHTSHRDSIPTAVWPNGELADAPSWWTALRPEPCWHNETSFNPAFDRACNPIAMPEPEAGESGRRLRIVISCLHMNYENRPPSTPTRDGVYACLPPGAPLRYLLHSL
jgi:hypothetical protein